MATAPATDPTASATTSTARHATLSTPFGPFTAVVDGDGVVLASGWTDDVAGLVALVHPAFRPESTVEGDLGPVAAAVTAFHEGDPGPSAAVPVRQRGGPFLEVVWARMRQIEAGSPMTYTELAERAGRPAAIRAAGAACSRNAVSLFVPCHRVLRSSGSLGGFRWGLDVKEQLLAMEAR